MSPAPRALLATRMTNALDPSPDTRRMVYDRVTEFARQLDDDAVLGEVVDAIEHPDPVTSVDLAAQAGVTYRQISYWTSSGWLTPVEGERVGSGNRLHYPPTMIAKARIMGSLVRMFSMSPARAAEIATEILDNGSAQVNGYTITREGPR
jgi:hypothetical protein